MTRSTDVDVVLIELPTMPSLEESVEVAPFCVQLYVMIPVRPTGGLTVKVTLAPGAIVAVVGERSKVGAASVAVHRSPWLEDCKS